jgi:hypothetical protein
MNMFFSCLKTYCARLGANTLLFCLTLSVVAFGTVSKSQDATPPRAVPKYLSFSPYMSYDVSAVPLALPSAGATIRRNDLIATFTIQPLSIVVTKVASIARQTTFPLVVPAGTKLFEVYVDSGSAFCPFWTREQGERNNQCFRDIDGDGTFDGSYSTHYPLTGASLYLGRLAALTGMPKIPYEKQSASDAPTDVWTYRFVRFRGETAEFKPQFGTNRLGFEPVRCNLQREPSCILGGYEFQFTKQGDALVVISVTPKSNQLRLVSEPYN